MSGPWDWRARPPRPGQRARVWVADWQGVPGWSTSAAPPAPPPEEEEDEEDMPLIGCLPSVPQPGARWACACCGQAQLGMARDLLVPALLACGARARQLQPQEATGPLCGSCATALEGVARLAARDAVRQAMRQRRGGAAPT